MRSLFTGLFLFFCCFCFAQKHTIKFYLKDEAAQPVENAVCKFIKDSKTIESISYTDSLGFSSTEIQKGDYLLSISLFGHILYETPVEIAQDTNLGTITVKSQTLLLDAVTITAKRKSYKEHDGKLVFDVQSLPITENVTAVDALAYTPLVTLTSSGIEVAGNTGEIRVNGIKQEKGASLLSYLNAVPLSEIERIEVHQGRTADMDASIEGGYVNIVMKNPSGFTGAVQATFGFNGVEGNDRPLFSENLNVSTIYGKGGLSLFANVAIGQAEPKGLKSITTSQIEQLRQEQKQESHTSNIRRQNIDASYGLNYTKGKHAFGIEGSLYGNLNSKSQREIDIQTALKDVVSTSQVEINEVPKVFSNSLTANYFFTPQKGKNKLHWLANFITNNDETQQDYFLYQPTSSQHQEYIGNKANSTMFYTQLSYSHQIIKPFSINVGTKYATTHRKNTNIFEIKDQYKNEDFYKYRENITSAYGNAQLSLDKWFMTVGLRMEYTDLKSYNTDIQQRYIDWFPSAVVSYKANEKVSIRLNYSRSVFRPPFALLNNYSIKTSEQVFSVGNPLLKAQKTDNIGLSFIFGRHILNFEWAYTPSPITNYIYSVQDTLYMTNINGGKQTTFDVSHSFGGKLFPFWHLSSNIGLQYIYLPESSYKQRILQCYASVRNTFSIGKAINISLNGNYASPWIMNDRKVEDRFNIDASIRYAIPKYNLSFILSGKNLIARRRTSSVTSNKYVLYKSWSETAPCSVTFGISWNFSGGKKKDVNYSAPQDYNMDKYRL